LFQMVADSSASGRATGFRLPVSVCLVLPFQGPGGGVKPR
jgi:hypothetical protein